MDRLVQRNVLAMSGRAVEAAGDVNTLLLDKTGTITLGNRQAAEFLPVDGVDRAGAGRRRPAVQPRRRDARGPLDRRAGQGAVRAARARRRACCRTPTFVAVHRADPDVRRRPRRTATDRQDPQGRGRRGDGVGPRERRPPDRATSAQLVDAISGAGGTPLVVAEHVDGQPARALGVIHLKDVVKAGHAGAVRRDAPDGHPDRDDHRRQPADRQGDRRRGRASTTSSPRPRPRTRWP